MADLNPTNSSTLPSARKAARRVLNFFIYIAIVGGIVVGLPKLLAWSLDTPYPMAAITSGSMWPVLKEGDLVFIHGVKNPAAELAKGDVIVYRNRVNNTLTIHRIVELRADTVVTKGDANFNPDTPAAYGDVVGRAITVLRKPIRIPYLGSITVYANNLQQEKSAVIPNPSQ